MAAAGVVGGGVDRPRGARSSCRRPSGCDRQSSPSARKIRVEVLAVHPLVVAAGNDVPDVLDHAVGDEHLTVSSKSRPQGFVVPWATASKIFLVG